MGQRTIETPVSSIILDEVIYPRKGIDHRRVGIFAENIRDGFNFDPIEVETRIHQKFKPPLRRYWKSHWLDKTNSGYIADLRAASRQDKDLKIFRMNHLGIPQDRIANRLGLNQASIHNHLLKMATLPNLINTDLSLGFIVSQMAQKHGWAEPMVWSLVLIQAPMSAQRFSAVVVSAMQKKRILGVTSRYVIIVKQSVR